MRYWLDTEFIEDGKTIELLSIGIVAEDGREFYMENRDADLSKASDWVRANVLPHLKGDDRDWPGVAVRKEDVALNVLRFCDPSTYGKPEFWGYYADYDWVVFCQLFGTMMDLPKGWPMYCCDLKQEADRIEGWMRVFNSAPDYKLRLPEQGKGEHHALADARWNRAAWEFLVRIAGEL
jgi:hypothetical protein